MKHQVVYNDEGGAIYFDPEVMRPVSTHPKIYLAGATFLFDEPDYMAMMCSVGEIPVLLRVSLRSVTPKLIDPAPRTVDDIRAIYRDLPQGQEFEKKFAALSDADVQKVAQLFEQDVPIDFMVKAMQRQA